jgi:5-methyltetrahydropteroyltriglutamate--homocysteine methyltransferase
VHRSLYIGSALYTFSEDHTHTVEAADDVRTRIRRGTTVLPADRIWVDPDCGLKTRTVEESRAKLGAMMSAVRAARAELG